MSEKSLLVTGNTMFVSRHRGLFEQLRSDSLGVRTYPFGDQMLENPAAKQILNYLHLGLRRIGPGPKIDHVFIKNAAVFRSKTRRVERKIAEFGSVDAVLQVFATFRTFTVAPRIPTFLLADYTTMLAVRNWPDWAYFPSERSLRDWLELERETFARARHVFAMSELVRSSLVEDYQLRSDQVSVVGSAPNVPAADRSPEQLATRSILFNGSEYHRKGGDIAFETIKLIRRRLPDIRLRVVGNRFPVRGEGVDSVGIVDHKKMAELLTTADLVLAPARCDPFPTFLIEAQQSGAPVVASARDGMTEIVVDGTTGRLIDSLEPRDFADAVCELLSDPAELRRQSDAARSRAQSVFSWAAIAPRIRNTIEAAIQS